MFRKKYTLNRVRDNVTIREGKEELHLYVDSDAHSIMARLQVAQKRLLSVTGEESKEERRETAKALADAMFGREQTEKLFEFYHNDETCVVTICGIYFSDKKNGLGKKIAKAQKKQK